METQTDFFIVSFISVDLYRSGNKNTPRLDKVRIPPREGAIDNSSRISKTYLLR